MISVIIPTMWQAGHIHKMLPIFDAHPAISEIIIIDNDPQRANHAELTLINKLVYIPQEKNQYVNPSWNIGFNKAKEDKLCICNDDCLVNLNFLSEFEKEITPDRGVIAFSESSFLHENSESLSKYDEFVNKGIGNSIKLVPRNDPMPHISYGVCMFIHRQSYYEIPDEFKIYFGDLFVYVLNKFKYNKQNFEIKDGFIMTKMSSTVLNDKRNQDIIEYERKIFYDVFSRYGLS